MNKSKLNYKLKASPRKNNAKRALAVIALGLFVSPMALAAKTLDDVVTAITTFQTSLVGQQVIPFVSYYQGLMNMVDTTYEPAASLANTSFKTASVGSFVRTQVDEKTLTKVAQVLTQANSGAQFSALAALPASDIEPNVITNSKPWNSDDFRLYANSLLGKDAYDQGTTGSTDKNNAEQAVVFLSDYTNPLGSIDLSTLTADQLKTVQTSVDGQQYLTHRRGKAAIRSLILSNFYSMLMARTPVKNLGLDAGLPGSSSTAGANGAPATAGSPDASPLQVERYIATRRVDDADWYTAMNKAPEIVVARETLFVLAEMEKQLFQIQQQNERILATLTATAVINLSSSTLLPDQNENDLRGQLGLAQTGPAAAITTAASQASDNNNKNNSNNNSSSNQANSALSAAGVTPPAGSSTTTTSGGK